LITEGVPVTDKAVADRAYGKAMAQYRTGSTLQRGIQAATAALQGLAGGDIAGALAGDSTGSAVAGRGAGREECG